MTLGHMQFEMLFAGLDWRRVRSLEVSTSELRGLDADARLAEGQARSAPLVSDMRT